MRELFLGGGGHGRAWRWQWQCGGDGGRCETTCIVRQSGQRRAPRAARAPQPRASCLHESRLIGHSGLRRLKQPPRPAIGCAGLMNIKQGAGACTGAATGLIHSNRTTRRRAAAAKPRNTTLLCPLPRALPAPFAPRWHLKGLWRRLPPILKCPRPLLLGRAKVEPGCAGLCPFRAAASASGPCPQAAPPTTLTPATHPGTTPGSTVRVDCPSPPPSSAGIL